MSEPALGPAERLGREVAILGARLAELLESALPPERAAPGQSFLHSIYDAALRGQPLAELKGGALERRPEGVVHPLDRLADALELSPFDVDLLLLAGLADEHEGYASVLRALHPRGEPRVTVGLCAQLLCRSAAERRRFRELIEQGKLAALGALRVDGRELPFYERSLLLADALWPALAGIDVWPAGVHVDATEPPLWGLEEWLGSAAAQRACAALQCGGPRTILVLAETEEIAWNRAAALAQHAGCRYARLALALEAERAVSLHALARGVVPIATVLADEPRAAEARPSVVLPRFTRHPAPVVLCARAGAAPLHGKRPVLIVPAERLSSGARRSMWRGALPELEGEVARLAARYALEPAAAAEVAGDVRSAIALRAGEIGVTDVAESLRARANLSLSSGVKLVRPSASWPQLVLSPERLGQLRDAVERLLNQSRVLDEWQFLAGRPGARGVRMLFSGPPGTGKSLSAEVVASALGVDLLVVDISRVVSKWIGETERNLAEVFDAAERAQAVLLFDEADALFGKRTEVADAHDRYANLETAYLLSRLERFEGLAILSTNLRQNIDPAFLRRIEFVVEYSEPSASERQALWRAHLPEQAPVASDVSLQELATLYPVVGGLIRNAAVAAGFLAAAAGTPITRKHLLRAIKREYEKSGRAFPGLPAGMAGL